MHDNCVHVYVMHTQFLFASLCMRARECTRVRVYLRMRACVCVRACVCAGVHNHINTIIIAPSHYTPCVVAFMCIPNNIL